MRVPVPSSSSHESGEKDQWLAFVGGTVAIHLMVLVLSPRVAGSLHSSAFWWVVSGCLFFWLLPFAWSIFLLSVYRTTRERLAAYVSLAGSVYWLLGVNSLLF